MGDNYYYLVSGLAELHREVPAPPLSFKEFADLLSNHLSPGDLLLFKNIQLIIDNGNLAALIEKAPTPFMEGGLFDKALLQEEIHNPLSIPPYMQVILEAWRSDCPIFHNITWEDQINWLFYEEMEKTPSPFLRQWFTFDLALKNLLAVMSCSEQGIPIERRMADRIENTCAQAVITRNEAAETIVNSSASDFSLSPVFPLASKILSLDRNDLESFERSVDDMRWDWLDEATELNYFDIDFILAYGLKLRIMERWERITPQAGKDRFHRLLSSLEASLSGQDLQEGRP